MCFVISFIRHMQLNADFMGFANRFIIRFNLVYINVPTRTATDCKPSQIGHTMLTLFNANNFQYTLMHLFVMHDKKNENTEGQGTYTLLSLQQSPVH